MGAARDPVELRDVPAVAVCATCGDPSCPGHDFEQSGERPVRRHLPWEDGQTTPMRALWRTAMASASDLDLWVRASTHSDGGVGPAFTFALACECVAVAVVCLPLAALASFVAWRWTHSLQVVGTILALSARVAVVFVPLMILIHAVHQTVLARAGARHSDPRRAAAKGTALRAGFYACGWDLATGPAGILASLFGGSLREARKRARGNNTLYREATFEWLRSVHGLEGEAADRARRATTPWMALLLVVTLLLTGWAFVSSL
jgi:hypothetical protein